MKSIQSLALLLIVLGIFACSPTVYSPNTHNAPLISEKGETNLTLSLGYEDPLDALGNILEFQGAYGITENIAIKANGGFTIISDQDNGDGGSAMGFEIGGGYFKPITKNLIFETYGIIGIGSFENHMPSTIEDFPLTNGNISANVIRVGVQPIFGYKSKYFSVAISSRIVHLSYNNIKGDLSYQTSFQGQSDYNGDQTIHLKENSSNFLVEPAIVIKGGARKFKLQMELGYSTIFNNDFLQYNSYNTYWGIGLNYNFNSLNSRVQTKKN